MSACPWTPLGPTLRLTPRGAPAPLAAIESNARCEGDTALKSKGHNSPWRRSSQPVKSLDSLLAPNPQNTGHIANCVDRTVLRRTGAPDNADTTSAISGLHFEQTLIQARYCLPLLKTLTLVAGIRPHDLSVLVHVEGAYQEAQLDHKRTQHNGDYSGHYGLLAASPAHPD